ncbi:MAG: SDR family oxidoreductase [Bryobacterales bacterium]|nr:SDR family oxidoreductase [Bryobacterales bacterium]
MRPRTGLVLAGAAGAGLIAWGAKRRASFLDLHGKLVLITGGSRGLGLQLAREFGARRARVAICARDADELNRAQQDLKERGINTHTAVCDVSDAGQVDRMIGAIAERLGPIDVLVNNAGIIRVGPIFQQTAQDFEDAMNTMFWGTLYPTLAVLPQMRERKKGRIVNITSIGGRVSVPHLVPYCCAKFAVVALSEGLRAELASSGIRVVTILPGLMRTGSHLNAEFKGKHKAEYLWFSAGAASPLVSIDAARAARSIVRATARGDAEKILSMPADLIARLHGIFPGLTTEIFGLVNRFLLPGSPESLTGIRTGAEAKAQLGSRVLEAITQPGQHAAEALNEL